MWNIVAHFLLQVLFVTHLPYGICYPPYTWRIEFSYHYICIQGVKFSNGRNPCYDVGVWTNGSSCFLWYHKNTGDTMNIILLASLEMKENNCPQHEEDSAETMKRKISLWPKSWRVQSWATSETKQIIVKFRASLIEWKPVKYWIP